MSYWSFSSQGTEDGPAATSRIQESCSQNFFHGAARTELAKANGGLRGIGFLLESSHLRPLDN